MDARTSGTAGRLWQVGQWLADGSMDSVAEINAQGLEFLCALAAQPARRLPEMFAGQAAAWRDLSMTARTQLAASPYLLVEAGFDEEERWLSPGRLMVQDPHGICAEPVFVGTGAEEFIRRVLVFAWHLARANRQLARVVLGMTPACAVRVAALRLQDLDWLVQHHPGWVRPRWEQQPRIWRHLLLAARAADSEHLMQVSLRGLQLMAAGMLGTNGNSPLLARKFPRQPERS